MPLGPADNYAAPVEINARSRPTHPAIEGPEGVLTHAAFAARVRGFADALAADGVRPGDFLGIALKDTAAHLVLLFAAMRLGAVIVPVDWRWAAGETEGLAAHFGIRHLAVEPDAPPVAGPARIEIGAAWQARATALPGLTPMATGPGLPMLLSLSSGTTGRPTGPVLTHAQMWARSVNQIAALTFTQHDRYMLATPLHFGGGRAFALTHLAIGATLVLNPPPWPAEALPQVVARTRASSIFLVPTMIRRLLALPDAALSGMRDLRVLVSSGAPLHPPERAAIARRLTPGFFEYFASTEGGGISILAPADQAAHPDSVGRAAFMVELEVVGEDHRPVPPGTVGAVRYRGPGVADGFPNDPAKSAEAFRDGWFYPGDLGRMDAEGFLTLMGRAKAVIIRGGVNIYPAEVERVLDAHPDIAEVAVFGIPDREMGEEICAAVVASAPLTADAVLAWCRGRLAPYKIPKRIEFLDALPRNAGGKVVPDRLRAMIGAG